ncbi:MAG: MlaD family protein [Candidatus Omnitrophota bacterium]
MTDNKSLELKVGLFVGMGIVIFFIIVFSIGDISFVQKGYDLYTTFSFVDGLAESAPVRYAGVDIGHVKSLTMYEDAKAGRVKVKVTLWISDDNRKVERDSVACINTLGLLGEKYLEIFPGNTAGGVLAPGELLVGKDPIMMRDVTDSMSGLADSAGAIMERLKNGEGTLGKLLVDDSLYNELNTIMTRLREGKGTMGKLLADDGMYDNLNAVLAGLKEGKGTIGKLLVDESIYDNLDEFVADIKAHPWKLLHKPSGRK